MIISYSLPCFPFMIKWKEDPSPSVINPTKILRIRKRCTRAPAPTLSFPRIPLAFKALTIYERSRPLGIPSLSEVGPTWLPSTQSIHETYHLVTAVTWNFRFTEYTVILFLNIFYSSVATVQNVTIFPFYPLYIFFINYYYFSPITFKMQREREREGNQRQFSCFPLLKRP